jgi:hypothetical protein
MRLLSAQNELGSAVFCDVRIKIRGLFQPLNQWAVGNAGPFQTAVAETVLGPAMSKRYLKKIVLC